ncbi:MAG: ATP phosphoribosyltransferase regulatory subunit [Cellvibrionaceae bacterium]|nr:ATP phosphoribosyltransferase regulatory subunit [Cellvibrionaceae bacterium]
MSTGPANVDRWLLPDGVEEMLPEQAATIEVLRRRLIDTYRRWGYDQVIPPLIEYTDSLLIGLGQDLDLLTFKMTDQLTGRTLGIRADITPQTARMDAHSLRREGPCRLCYAGHVLHAKPKGPLATRSPIQAGVELFGEAGLDADIEVVSLMLETLNQAGLKQANIDLGHVGIYRAVAEAAGLNETQQGEFFELLQHKASSEIEQWLGQLELAPELAALLKQLPRLAGGPEILAEARRCFEEVSEEALAAVDELEAIAEVIAQRYPATQMYFDLSEVRGYNYHTGLVFAAFADGVGQAIANGGRYDHIGEVFGRARPATGFGVDVTKLAQLQAQVAPAPGGIYAPASEDPAQWQAIVALRAAGERVVCGLASNEALRQELGCDRKLEQDNGNYKVVPWT